MHLDESIVVFPDWFQLRFIENNGAAFVMHIASRGGFDWGKLLLGVFRIVMVGFIGWLMHHLCTKRQDTPEGVIVGLALIFAGAMGNILDSAFYGLIFSESTPYTVAQFGGHYAGFMMGKVVDMFYFPLFQWNGVPRLLRFLVDSNNYFFGAIFNLADAYISVAVVYLLLFQHSSSASDFFEKELVFQKKYYFLHTAIPEMPSGGIGRRARFRCVCRKACRFDSCLGTKIPLEKPEGISFSVSASCPQFHGEGL